MMTNESFDPDIEKALKWFLGFMPKGEWETRKKRIEDSIDHRFMVAYGLAETDAISLPLSIREDRIGWYLYLVEVYITDLIKYEPVQGARIVPIFKRLGEDFDQWQSIEGVKKIGRNLVTKDKTKADAVLFEMLTALLWVRNGWQVAFIPEKPPGRMPDLSATKGGVKWNIECKRMGLKSPYHEAERDKWYKMLKPLRGFLMKNCLVLDVTFHVEIVDLPDNFLEERLTPLLTRLKMPGCITSDEVWDVEARFLDREAIDSHFKKYRVKNGSTQVAELIGGYRDTNRGFSFGTIAPGYSMRDGRGFDHFIDHIERAFGVFWSSDADAAVEKKAKDIHRQLVDACRQFPAGQNAFLHVGIETFDGGMVEERRFKKIMDTMSTFDMKGIHLSGINLNFFQSYAPPYTSWEFDESNYNFKNMEMPFVDPLPEKMMIVPWGETEENLHWFKDQP